MPEFQKNPEATKRYELAAKCLSEFIFRAGVKPGLIGKKQRVAVMGLLKFMSDSEIGTDMPENEYAYRTETIRSAFAFIMDAKRESDKYEKSLEYVRHLHSRFPPVRWEKAPPEPPPQFEQWCDLLWPPFDRPEHVAGH